MNEPAIRARLSTIEEQVRVLKAELRGGAKPKRRKSRSFADLYGQWKGKVDLSFEDIQDSEIRLKGTR